MSAARDGLAGRDEAVEALAQRIGHDLAEHPQITGSALAALADGKAGQHSPAGLRERVLTVIAGHVIAAAEPVIAARVRAEAAAGERQRIAELVTAALVPDDVDEWSDNNEGWNRALGRVLRDLRAAAGSVPVATPAEPDCACPFHWPGGHGAMPWATGPDSAAEVARYRAAIEAPTVDLAETGHPCPPRELGNGVVSAHSCRLEADGTFTVGYDGQCQNSEHSGRLPCGNPRHRLDVIQASLAAALGDGK